jgi:hypothetical protein
MLDKCATPDCNRRFKYFGVGLLFVAPPKKKAHSNSGPEFFWLCERCARRENEMAFKRLPVVVGPPLRRAS